MLTTLLRWFVPWEPSWVVALGFAAAALLYLRGSARRQVPWPRHVAWWTGLGLVYVGLHTRLDYYAEHEFFVHRLQHLGLHHLGPFLIALAYPGVVLRAALPLRWRVGGLRPLLAGGDRAEKFRALMSERVPLYRRTATIRVNTNRRNPGAVVRMVFFVMRVCWFGYRFLASR